MLRLQQLEARLAIESDNLTRVLALLDQQIRAQLQLQAAVRQLEAEVIRLRETLISTGGQIP